MGEEVTRQPIGAEHLAQEKERAAARKKMHDDLEKVMLGIRKERSIPDDSLLLLDNIQRRSLDDVISTNNVAIDAILGGGFPRGRIIEAFGSEGAGKTTLCIQAAGCAQRAGLSVGFIDMEHGFDPTYARALGLDPELMLFSQPDFGEQGLEIAEGMVQGGIDLVIVDSVAALVPKKIIEGDFDSQHVGIQARMMSQALARLSPVVGKTHSCLLLINQIRMMIGVMYGDNTTTPGGKALKFYSSVRIRVNMGKRLKIGSGNNQEDVGHVAHINVVKNKVYPPFKKASVDLYAGVGFDRVGALIDPACDAGMIEQGGAYYTLAWAPDSSMGTKTQGRDNLLVFFREQPASWIDAYEAELRRRLFT